MSEPFEPVKFMFRTGLRAGQNFDEPWKSIV
jgi:hypothetical protein